MTAHFNRASHANPYKTWLHVEYTPAGTPQTTWDYNGGATCEAISAYIAFRDDPILEPKPTMSQVRLVAEYCQYYINAPILTGQADELRRLRAGIEYIRTLCDLADWLWDCRRIGIDPL